MEILRKNQRNSRGQNTVRQMKDAFDDSISRLDTAEEGTSELEDMTETAKIAKSKRKKTEKIKPEWNMQNFNRTATKHVTYA